MSFSAHLCNPKSDVFSAAHQRAFFIAHFSPTRKDLIRPPPEPRPALVRFVLCSPIAPWLRKRTSNTPTPCLPQRPNALPLSFRPAVPSGASDALLCSGLSSFGARWLRHVLHLLHALSCLIAGFCRVLLPHFWAFLLHFCSIFLHLHTPIHHCIS